MAAPLYIGLMSGTSADGVDACLAAIPGGGCRERGYVHLDFDAPLRETVVAVARGSSLRDAATLDVRLADTYAAAVDRLLEHTGVRRRRVRAIGCHGQTVLHRPEGAEPTSIQLGDPHRLAVRTGVDVVADFRRADVAAGGQGAPLAPAFHEAVFRAPGETRVVVNVGGMANITVLEGHEAPVRGCDTGPGNVLLDAWAARFIGQRLDTDGAWGAGGRVDERLLARLADDLWLRRPPPKSTGREHFDIAWLDGQLAADGVERDPVDVQATLAELTAATVADAIAGYGVRPERILVCGGGARNADLLARLARRLPDARVMTTAEHGIEPEHVEAMAFAWLAQRRIRGLPGNCPEVTGASRALVLGSLIRAPR